MASSPNFDPGSYAMGEYLRMYNDPGTLVKGKAGIAGHTVSMAPQRGRAQSSFDAAKRDSKQVYSEATKSVTDRNPGITAGYDKASASLQANARQRALASASADTSRDTDMLKAAHDMGLSVAPQTHGTRADEIQQGGIAKTNINADAWQGFNSSTGQRAVERNNSVADAFTWQGAQQQQALQGLLQQTLAGLVDYYVAPVAGTADKYVGGLTNAQKMSALGHVSQFGQNDFRNDLAYANSQKTGSGKTTSVRIDPKGGKSTTITTRE